MPIHIESKQNLAATVILLRTSTPPNGTHVNVGEARCQVTLPAWPVFSENDVTSFDGLCNLFLGVQLFHKHVDSGRGRETLTTNGIF